MKLIQRGFALACGMVPLALAHQAMAQTDGSEDIEPVGQRPPPAEAPEIQAIPDIGGVLTPRGRLVIEPEFQYSHASVNRLTFRGVEILNTLQVGVLAAEDIDRDTLTASVTGRLGVTDRLELELKVPYLYRDDSQIATVNIDEENQFDVPNNRDGDGLGDIEAAVHYQINTPPQGSPYFVGNLRYKSTTGDGPFDVRRNSEGIEQELPTGSGFHSIEPSITMLLPSAPAVYFANIGYLFNLEDDVDETVGDFRIDDVDPGDAVRLSFGMAYSINPQSSFTLGYKNDFIAETDTTFTDLETGTSTTQDSRSLNVGSMLLGWTYQFSDDSVFNLNLEFGITEDAPDTTLTLRAPIGLNVF
ncbi:transporter [Halomonas organivorans]